MVAAAAAPRCAGAPPERCRSTALQPARDNHRRWPPARLSRASSRSAAASTSAARLEVGGCDTIELAREFGTPAYVVAEDDLRARARAFLQAGREAGHERLPGGVRLQGLPLHAPCCELFAAGGAVVRRRLRRRAAPGARRRLSRRSGSCCTATPSPRPSCGWRCATAWGDRDRQLRRDRAPASGCAAEAPAPTAAPSRCWCASPRTSRGETHEKISTGQADSKFGFAMDDAPRGDRAGRRDRRASRCRACTPTSAPSCSSLEPVPRARRASSPRLGEFPVWDLGGGLGVRYTEDQPAPPSIEEYVAALVAAARGAGMAPSGAC